MFHYTWLLLPIMLVAWELPGDSQFPSIALDLPEVAKYASLWVTNDAQHIKDSKIFWILMEMNIRMAINQLQLQCQWALRDPMAGLDWMGGSSPNTAIFSEGTLAEHAGDRPDDLSIISQADAIIVSSRVQMDTVIVAAADRESGGEFPIASKLLLPDLEAISALYDAASYADASLETFTSRSIQVCSSA